MSKELLYDFLDDSGSDRIVRIVPGGGGIGAVGGAKNFQVMVADIEDIETKDRFPGVAMARLNPRESE